MANKQLSPEIIAEIRRLHSQGMMQKTIAERVGVCATTVAKYTLRIEAPPPSLSLRSTYLVIRAIQNGKFTDAEIACAFDASRRFVAELRRSIVARERDMQDTERWLQRELRNSARGMYSN